MSCTCKTPVSFLFNDKDMAFELKLYIVKLSMQKKCISCNKIINKSPCKLHKLCNNCLFYDPIYECCFV